MFFEISLNISAIYLVIQLVLDLVRTLQHLCLQYDPSLDQLSHLELLASLFRIQILYEFMLIFLHGEINRAWKVANLPSSGGGGPSIVIDTIDSPRNNTKPSTRFSSRSGNLLFFGRILRNSSQSPNIKFMCLSNALNVPMNVRESWSTMRTR